MNIHFKSLILKNSIFILKIFQNLKSTKGPYSHPSITTVNIFDMYTSILICKYILYIFYACTGIYLIRDMFLMFSGTTGLLSDVHGIKNCRKKSEVVFQWLIKYIHIFEFPL